MRALLALLFLAQPAVADTVCAVDGAEFSILAPPALAPFVAPQPMPDGVISLGFEVPGAHCSFLPRRFNTGRYAPDDALRLIFRRDLESTAKALARPLELDEGDGPDGWPFARAALLGAGVPPALHSYALIPGTARPRLVQGMCLVYGDTPGRAVLWEMLGSIHGETPEGVSKCP